MGLWLSIISGLGLSLVNFPLSSLITWFMPRVEDTLPIETIPVWIILPVILVSIIMHEFLHLICHPGWGMSEKSVTLIWLCKFQFGAYYDGFMVRSRWLAMRLMPFIVLTILPAVFISTLWVYRISFFWLVYIMLTMFMNSLGSGSDILATYIVSRQVPAIGTVGIWNGRAFWRLLKP